MKRSPQFVRRGRARPLRAVALVAVVALACGRVATDARSTTAAEPAAAAADSQRNTPGLDDPRIDGELLKRLRVAEIHEDQGEYEQAVVAYREVYNSLKRALPEDHVVLLCILDRVSDIRVVQGRTGEAEGPLTKVVTLRERSRDVGETARLAADLLKLGRIHGMTGKPEAAIEPLEKGRQLLEKLLGDGHELVGLADGLLAEAEADQGRYAEAAARLRARAELAARNRGTASPEAFAARDRLAGMLMADGRYRAAIDSWSKSLAVRGPAGRDRSAAALDRLRWLAVAHALAGEEEEGVSLARRCLRSSSEEPAADEADRACDAALLAVCLEMHGRGAEAAPHFERFLAAARAASRPPAAIRCEQLRFLVRELIDRGLIDRAAAVTQAILACDERRTAPAPVAVADDQTLLASCLLAGGDMAAAESLLRQAIMSHRTHLGDAHAKTLAAIVLLGRSAAARGDADAAADAAESLMRRSPPGTSRRQEVAMADLVGEAAALLDRAGKSARADELRESWLSKRAGRQTDQPASADVLVAYGNAFDAIGQPARAIPFYERARQLRATALGQRHPAVAAVLLPLARDYLAAGRADEARRVAEQCLAVWRETIGLDHEATIETLLTLASATAAAGDPQAAAPIYDEVRVSLERRRGADDPQLVAVLTRLAEAKKAGGDAAAARVMLARAAEIQAGGGRAMDLVPGGAASASLEKAREIAMLGDKVGSNADVLGNDDSLGGAAAASRAVDRRLATGDRASGADDDRGTAADLLEVAARMRRNGNRNAAGAALTQALEDARRKHGREHPRVAEILVAIGDLLVEDDDFSAAFKAYQQALDIHVKITGESDVEAALIGLKLAACLQVSGGREAALSLVSLALSRIPPAVDARIQERLAATLRSAADYALAVADYATAAAILERLAAEEARSNSPGSATLEDLATAHERAGAAAKSVPLRQRLLDAARQAGDATAARRLVELARSVVAAGRPQEAVPLLQQARAADEARFGPSHPRVAADRLELAAVAEALGKPDDAAKLLADAMTIVAGIVQVPDDGDTESLRILAACLRRRGDLAEAARVIQLALEFDMRQRGRRHRETAKDHRELALIRRLEGDLDRAGKNYDRVVSILSSSHGPGDHRVVAARFELADMLERGNQGIGRDGVIVAAKSPGNAAPPVDTPNAYREILLAHAAAGSSGTGPAAAGAADSSAAITAAGDKARRMLDAAKGLYGGGAKPTVSGSAGPARKKGGLDAFVNYVETVQSLAASGDQADVDRALQNAAAGGQPLAAGTGRGPAAIGPVELARAASALAAPPAIRAASAGRSAGTASAAPATARELLADAWRRHLAGDPAAADRSFEAALAAAEKVVAAGNAADVSPRDVVEQHAAALVERGDLAQARGRLEDLVRRLASGGGADASAVVAAEGLLVDVLIGLGEYRAAWPLARANVRVTRVEGVRETLAHAESLIRLATLEAAVGRNGLAAGRLQEAGVSLAGLFGKVSKPDADRQVADDVAAADRRLFRAAVAFARACLAEGEWSRAEAAVWKTMKSDPLVTAATAADLDAALALLAIASFAADDLPVARWASGRLRAARQRRFGPNDLRTLTAEACDQAFAAATNLGKTAAASGETAVSPDPLEPLRRTLDRWLAADGEVAAAALCADVLPLIPAVTAVLRRGGEADVGLARATRGRCLEMARARGAAGHPAWLTLAEEAAVDEPSPAAAAEVERVRTALLPDVRPLAGTADRRVVQASTLEAVGEPGWSGQLRLAAARETVEAAARAAATSATAAAPVPAAGRRFPFRAAPARSAAPAPTASGG